MKYDELIKELKECDACLRFCVEYCPKTSKLNKDGKCPTTLTKKAADAIEELLGVIQRQKEMINATAYLPLYQKPKWIPVSERLPDTDKCVLVISYGRVCFAKLLLTINNCGFPTFVLQDGLNNPPVLETTAHNEFTENRITHWQYLPEPPKEETDG